MKLNQQNYISMDDSTILYGIAILLMVFHHCFATPSRLGNQYIPCLFGFESEARLAYIGRMCVGIYAFISGYALSRKTNPHSEYLPHFVCDVKISLNALIKFYSKFWLIFAIFIPIGVRFFDYEHLSSILRLPWILNAAIVIFLLAVRWFVVSDPGDSRYDIVILPFWMFNVVQLVHSFGYRNAVASILLSLGRNSTNMWLLHTFWLYYYFQPIILLPRYSILIFLWAVLISYVNARAVDWLSHRIGIPRAVSRISAWIMGPTTR